MPLIANEAGPFELNTNKESLGYMSILVIYYMLNKDDRNTINEHLYSFKKYSSHECYYLNTAYGIPAWVTRIEFNLVVFHYTFLAYLRRIRWRWYEQVQRCEDLRGYKVAIPQDEYYYSDRLNEFCLRSGIKAIFTCLPKSEWQSFPEQVVMSCLGGYLP